MPGPWHFGGSKPIQLISKIPLFIRLQCNGHLFADQASLINIKIIYNFINYLQMLENCEYSSLNAYSIL